MEYNKLLVVGEDNSGKSCYVRRLRTNEVEMMYIPTMGVEVHPIPYSPVLTYKVWDTSGQVMFEGLGDGYYIGGECCLIFFDLSRNRTQVEIIDMLTYYVVKVRRVCEDIPIVIVGNKRDLVSVDDLPDLGELPHCFISSREGANMELPLQMITQNLN